MYSNLLKRGFTVVKEEDKRVIDTNSLIAKKLEDLATAGSLPEDADGEGFTGGLDALLSSEDEAGKEGTGIIKAKTEEPEYDGPTPEELRREAEEEIAVMREEAKRTLEAEKKKALEEAKKQGYEEGHAQALREYQAKEQQLAEARTELETWYQQQIDVLEPAFIETLTGIYEHIFHMDFRGHREVIVHLINATLRKIEGSRDFIIHVSKGDYPYVSMQKKQILAGAGTGNSSVEIIEDITLSDSECLIETISGIFDCSVETELEELTKKLRLLSYEQAEEQE